MIVINADDFGRNRLATDRIVACQAKKRITSASAMVFMEDSQRAAALAKSERIDVGLHINFTETFTCRSAPQALRRDHERIRKFLRASKYALVIYSPFLRRAFRDVFQGQVDEFTRLYGQPPARFDGHQHMHLCSNMILDCILPRGAKVRRSFSFRAEEKSLINRRYRAAIDRRITKRHCTTDYFFALSQHLPIVKLQRVFELASRSAVELMTHPEVNSEFEVLSSTDFATAISQLPTIAWSAVSPSL